MKKTFFKFISLFIFIVLVFFLQSCNNEKYTVWTDIAYYSDWVASGGQTIQEGNYVKVELTSSYWEEMSKTLTNEGKHRWDEATIKKWLIGNGFGETEATREAAWLSLVNHGMILHHDNNMIHLILK